SRRDVLAGPHRVPSRRTEVLVAGHVIRTLQCARSDVGFREVGDGVTTRLEEGDGGLAVGDPGSAGPHPPAPAQPLGIEEPLRQRIGHQESTDCPRREWTLLPRQSHACLLLLVTKLSDKERKHWAKQVVAQSARGLRRSLVPPPCSVSP